MTSKKISLSNLVSPKNKNNAEGKHFSKYIFQLKKNSSYNQLQDSKIQIVFKKDKEIQNNSITEEDEYNEEIYNNSISTFKFMLNNDNDDNKTKSSNNSSKDKSKNLYLFKRNKFLKNNEKHDKHSIDCITDVNNYDLKDNNKFPNGENYFFMNLIDIFDKNNKNIKNVIENNLQKKEYKITDKFSRKNRKKKLKINNGNLDVDHSKSPSLLYMAKNDKKNIINKVNLTDNKIGKKILKIKPKNNITLKEEEVNIQKNNNLKSITKNLFTKNFELNDTKIDKKIKSSRFHIGLNKKIMSNKDSGVINLPVNKNNNNSNKVVTNSKIINSSINRKSKSMISEESLDHNNNINKKVEFGKKVTSPHAAQNIIIKKKIYLDEELIDKEKILSQKKSFVENSVLNLNNQIKNDSSKYYRSFLNLNINIGQIKDKNNSDKKNEKYLYSNSNSRNKENNEIKVNNNNSINSDINNSNNSNNKRRFFLNNSSSSQMKEEIKKPMTNNSIKNIRPIEHEKNQFSNNINFKKISLDQPKLNESIKIKIEKPLLHSRQISSQNILNSSNNNNKPNLIRSITNLNQITNLKKQSMNPQNNIKINLDISQRKQNLINSRSCIFKPDSFKKEYNYNQIILNSNLKLNNNKNSINSFKSPLSQISSAQNDEKTTNASKCDEISTDRSFLTKHIIINRNNGEKNTLNNSRNKNNNNLSNINSIKRDLKNTTNSNNENKNNIEQNNRKIYVREENHQNNFRRSHKIHEINSVSIDKSINKKDDPFSSKVKNQFIPRIISTSMDNIRPFRRYKKDEKIETNNINRIKAYGN